MVRAGALMIAVMISGSIWTSAASARTLVVDDDTRQCPTAQYRTIQSAVDAAVAADRVSVCAGRYREQVWIRPGREGLVVESTPRRAAVILAPAQFVGLPRAIVVAAARESIVRGFRILGPLPPNADCGAWFFTHDAGVQIGSGLVRVEDNEIDNIRDNCGRGDGIFAGDAQDELGFNFVPERAVISANLIKNYTHAGIIVEGLPSYPEAAVRIIHNKIAGARTSPTTGIVAAQEGIVDAEDNLIHSNRGPGIELRGLAALDEIQRNRIRGNGTGIEIMPGRDRGPLIEDNDISANRSHGIVDGGSFGGGLQILDNVVRDNGGHGLLLEAFGFQQPGIVERNRVLRNRLDGIHVGETFGHWLNANTVLGNGLFDCRDTTTGGPGTAGTNNTWTANRGRTSSPPGLCLP